MKHGELLSRIGQHFQTGSRVICAPPVMDTDDDWVFIYSPAHDQYIREAGGIPSYEEEGKRYNNSSVIQCYKLGELNLIGVNEASYECWYHATRIAKRLWLNDKAQRVALFQLLTEGRIRGTDLELSTFLKHLTPSPEFGT